MDPKRHLLDLINKVAKPILLAIAIEKGDSDLEFLASNIGNDPIFDVIRMRGRGEGTLYNNIHRKYIQTHSVFSGAYDTHGPYDEHHIKKVKNRGTNYLPFIAHFTKTLINETFFTLLYTCCGDDIMDIMGSKDAIIIPYCKTFDEDGLNFNTINADYLQDIMGYKGKIIMAEKHVDEYTILGAEGYISLLENLKDPAAILNAIKKLYEQENAHSVTKYRWMNIPGVQRLKNKDVDWLLTLSKQKERSLRLGIFDDSHSRYAYTYHGLCRPLLCVSDAKDIDCISVLREF